MEPLTADVATPTSAHAPGPRSSPSSAAEARSQPGVVIVFEYGAASASSGEDQVEQPKPRAGRAGTCRIRGVATLERYGDREADGTRSAPTTSAAPRRARRWRPPRSADPWRRSRRALTSSPRSAQRVPHDLHGGAVQTVATGRAASRAAGRGSSASAPTAASDHVPTATPITLRLHVRPAERFRTRCLLAVPLVGPRRRAVGACMS